ncbi:hypothetical protein [Streptomyces phaeochromogenes]|uniref:hypothetical protein n=1 Tax=Streptomyces phaeochromogenes TaxID=1923 RepID=UPI0037123D96
MSTFWAPGPSEAVRGHHDPADRTPDDLAGQALGLHATGMAAMQGVGAVLAGTLAQLTSPATAMTMMAAASVTVTLSLAVLGRRGTRQPADRGTHPGVLPEPAATD